MYTLLIFSVTTGLTGLTATVVMTVRTIRAARDLHLDMLKNILRSPGLFFDITPLGRIVNRFSKDTDTIDWKLPNNIGGSLYTTYKVLGTILVVGISTPWTLTVFVPLGVLYYFIQVLFFVNGPVNFKCNFLFSMLPSFSIELIVHYLSVVMSFKVMLWFI